MKGQAIAARGPTTESPENLARLLWLPWSERGVYYWMHRGTQLHAAADAWRVIPAGHAAAGSRRIVGQKTCTQVKSEFILIAIGSVFDGVIKDDEGGAEQEQKTNEEGNHHEFE